MKILIAPDKFKGTLDAREVAQNIAKGLRDVLSDADIEIIPMADGGEGTAEAICDARGCSWVQCKAHDALGREIYARMGYPERLSSYKNVHLLDFGHGETVDVEMSHPNPMFRRYALRREMGLV